MVQYDPAQRAYVVQLASGQKENNISLRIQSSREHPLVNPAFVFEGWDRHARVHMEVDGKPVAVASRIGVERSAEESAVVIFLKSTMEVPVVLNFDLSSE